MSYNVAVKSFNTFRNSKHSTASSPRESSVSHKIVINHQTLNPKTSISPKSHSNCYFKNGTQNASVFSKHPYPTSEIPFLSLPDYNPFQNPNPMHQQKQLNWCGSCIRFGHRSCKNKYPFGAKRRGHEEKQRITLHWALQLFGIG